MVHGQYPALGPRQLSQENGVPSLTGSGVHTKGAGTNMSGQKTMGKAQGVERKIHDMLLSAKGTQLLLQKGWVRK